MSTLDWGKSASHKTDALTTEPCRKPSLSSKFVLCCAVRSILERWDGGVVYCRLFHDDAAGATRLRRPVHVARSVCSALSAFRRRVSHSYQQSYWICLCVTV